MVKPAPPALPLYYFSAVCNCRRLCAKFYAGIWSVDSKFPNFWSDLTFSLEQ